MPLLIQLMRGAKIKDDRPADPYPVVILDLKGDSALFHTARIEAERRAKFFNFSQRRKMPRLTASILFAASIGAPAP
jgi:hypothetical protein